MNRWQAAVDKQRNHRPRLFRIASVVKDVYGQTDTCLCGIVHVKTAAIIVGGFLALLGALLLGVAFTYFAIDGKLNLPQHIFSGTISLIIGLVTIYAAHTERRNLLLPAIVALILVIFALFITLILVVIFVNSPASFAPTLRDFVKRHDSIAFMFKPKALLFGLTVTISLALSVWFLKTICDCYEYLSKLDRRKARDTEAQAQQN
ncbi:hypothetical protein QR680_015551 [Steinernema hermaphroditum]|uniref:Uncharacterized protein n=1 Tax=Steinernema hermaphroditum TaxID=289476 RepID=A0AA39HAD0_9BILA|nr:hypothetical protein QR680_015551 [Steinernema hermaphroditum]